MALYRQRLPRYEKKSAEGIKKGAEELAGKGADTIKDYSGYAAAEEYRKAAEEYRKAA